VESPSSVDFASQYVIVLGWLEAGMTEEEILEEHPDLEKADFAAVYQYAAEAGRSSST
jgi:uncharacterized protein (DUF433 family)